MPIRRAPSGRYQVRVSLGGGQRVERTLPAGATRADAKALEHALQRRAVDAAVGRQPVRLIVEALDRWIEDARRLKSWEKDLRYRVEIVRKYCADKPLAALADIAAQVKADGAANGLSAAAVNRYLAILRRVGNLAERWGWTDLALGRRVQLVPGERQRDVLITRAQVEALAGHCGPVAGDAVRFLAMTGLRRGELLRLVPADIVDACIVLDTRTKSGKGRAVPLPAEATRIAAARLPWALTEKELRREFESARAAAGLPGVRLHDLRHAYASQLAATGAHAADMRDLLGHSSLAVTSRYTHVSADRLRAAVDAAFPGPRRASGSGHRTKRTPKPPKAA